jgi:asparagine synthase (glutamine-hydrolysing)
VEAAVQLPIHLKIKGMTEKFALREAAKEVLTPTVYQRQKHPFLAPPITFSDKSNRLYGLLQDTLRSSSVAELPHIDAKKLVAFLDGLENRPISERASADPMLTGLLSAVLLQKRFHVS